MNKQDFLEAMEIISENHSTKIEINHVGSDKCVGDIGRSNFTIHITDCCGAVITNLKLNSYILSMKNGKTSINKF